MSSLLSTIWFDFDASSIGWATSDENYATMDLDSFVTHPVAADVVSSIFSASAMIVEAGDVTIFSVVRVLCCCAWLNDMKLSSAHKILFYHSTFKSEGYLFIVVSPFIDDILWNKLKSKGTMQLRGFSFAEYPCCHKATDQLRHVDHEQMVPSG